MNALLLTALMVLPAASDAARLDDGVRAAPAVIYGATHHGDVASKEIVWSSAVLLRVDDERDVELVRVSFARPLARGVVVTLRDSSASVELDDEGRAVAVAVRASQLGYGGASPWGTLRRLDLSARQPLPSDEDLTLHAPFPAGDAVQRVTLSAATPLRFTPDEALDIERRIGRSAATDVHRDERRRLDRWIGAAASMTGERLYLRAGPAFVDVGLRGSLERAPAQRAGVGLAAALVFGLLVTGGGLLYRRAARQAEIERVDAFLEEELRDFG